MPRPTDNERTANEFDRRLFGLIETARQRSQMTGAATGGRFSERWATVLCHLIDARPSVRGMMNKADREATS